MTDLYGAAFTAFVVLSLLLGGCGASSKPCAAWNGARAAACAVCNLPSCNESVGGGEVLEEPAPVDAELELELDAGCE